MMGQPGFLAVPSMVAVHPCGGVAPRAATIKTPVRTGKGGFVLWTIVVILVILWLLGALGTVSLPILSGSTVHLLLVIVIIIVVLQLLRR
jgi:hypothetical protein